jgi:hypothetical protein
VKFIRCGDLSDAAASAAVSGSSSVAIASVVGFLGCGFFSCLGVVMEELD